MKKITCDCGHVIMGETEDDVMEKAWEHTKAAHQEKADEILKLSKPERDILMAGIQARIEDA